MSHPIHYRRYVKANVIIPPFVRIDFPGKVLDKLSMNARSWLIKPNDASDIMAAKIHEMKKRKRAVFHSKASSLSALF